MRIGIVAFTARGVQLARRLRIPLGADVFVPPSYAMGDILPMENGVREWARAAFCAYSALIFIGAAGIAVRAVAPFIKDKTTDPAVVVLDERAMHVIPILSGHIGGANELALKIGELTGARPVITTATDLNEVPAIDTWAVKNDMVIENKDAIKAVSSSALNGEPVGVAITERAIEPPFPMTLFLRPRTLTVGVGCKRNVDSALLEKNLLDFLKICGVSPLAVCSLASIDRKADERALLDFTQKYNIPLAVYSAEDLREVQGSFTPSRWVEKTVGVDNVCERAAVRNSGGFLLMGKTIYEGMTFALATKEANI